MNQVLKGLFDMLLMNQRFALTCCLMTVFWLCLCPSFDSAFSQPPTDEKKVLDALSQISTQFSAAYVKGDIEKLVSFYTDDAVIFPGNSDLIRGKEAIKKYWNSLPKPE